MGYSVVGTQYILFTTTVGTSATPVLNNAVYGGANSQHNGSLLIQNASKTAYMAVGLAGETPAIGTAGYQLPPLTAITFDAGEGPVNPILGISDTNGATLVIYGIGA